MRGKGKALRRKKTESNCAAEVVLLFVVLSAVQWVKCSSHIVVVLV